MQPGWYPAQGDPPGTQRYWDGAQWVGEPQAVAAPSPPPGFAAPPAYGQPPTYGAPGGSGAAAPSGYVPFAAVALHGAARMQPAPIGKRLTAWLIDLVPFVVIFAIMVGCAVALGDASAPITIVLSIVALFYAIWNYWWRRGRSGQSIGDSQMGIKLVKNDTAQPVGGGMVFLRWFVTALISNLTCGLFGLLDILWPLWDERNNRLGDKMLSMTVVVAEPAAIG